MTNTARQVNEVREKLRIARNLLQDIAMNTQDEYLQTECHETADVLGDHLGHMKHLYNVITGREQA